MTPVASLEKELPKLAIPKIVVREKSSVPGTNFSRFGEIARDAPESTIDLYTLFVLL